ncbi:YjhT family mutarotase [Photobacterium sp. MCCC 1A19761]|uniref:YjhT family mutarotase n=1 Tax=Photobacterium sp. MCCC 1A19761 TaxID=3115000 RepID=UPI00307E0B60
MTLHITSFAKFPVGLKNGVGGKIGRRLYAGLGSAGSRFFCYDLDAPSLGWQAVAAFPGIARNDAVAIPVADGLYVFSGAGSTDAAHPPQVLMDGYYFDGRTGQWQQLDTVLPIGLLGASGCEIQPGYLVFFGGYNNVVFDRFLASLAKVDQNLEPERYQRLFREFMSQPVEAYGWNQNIWCFDVEHNHWHILQPNPFSANCGAGMIHDGHTVTLIEGEIKPGLRSTQIKQFIFHSRHEISCQLIPSIVASDSDHEGLAGSYSGQINNNYVIAGGTYFQGSQHNFRKGQWYTHLGLTKHYTDSIWRLDGTCWHKVGCLPSGAAYGISLTTDNGMILIGGENSQGEPLTSCYVLDWIDPSAPL